jgi:hypothetical protein
VDFNAQRWRVAENAGTDPTPFYCQSFQPEANLQRRLLLLIASFTSFSHHFTSKMQQNAATTPPSIIAAQTASQPSWYGLPEIARLCP